MSKPFADLKEITKAQSNEWDKFCKDESPDAERMREINNGFGKIVKSFQVQIEVARINKQAASLDF